MPQQRQYPISKSLKFIQTKSTESIHRSHNYKSIREIKRPGGIVIRIVADNNSVIPRAPGEDPTVPSVVLNVAYHSSFGNGSERQDVSDHEIGLSPAIHELPGVHALGSDEKLVLLLVAKGVAEGDASERRSAARVVHDLRDHSLEVAVSLREVETAEASRAFAVVGVGLEDGPRTLTLSTNDTTHW
jgi:hypothetical protein